jgi:hypothetical protein
MGAAEDGANRLRRGNDPVRGLLLSTGGRLEINVPLRHDLHHPARTQGFVPLRTRGALFTRAHRKVCNVEIELSPWTHDVTEIALRPAVRSPYGWGAGRLRRWFTHAHAAADELCAALLLPPAAVIDLTDTERERLAEGTPNAAAFAV